MGEKLLNLLLELKEEGWDLAKVEVYFENEDTDYRIKSIDYDGLTGDVFLES